MKVLVLTYGSRGDVQPFVSLAKTLRARGHEATVCGPAGWASLAEPHGVSFVPLIDVSDELMSNSKIREGIESDFRGLRGKLLAARVIPMVRRMRAAVLDDIAAIAHGMSSSGGNGVDLVVHHETVPGHAVAERLGVPAVPVCPNPTLIPTGSFQNPRFPFPLPSALNRASYLWTKLWTRCFAGNNSKWRQETLGLARRPGHNNVLRRPDGTPATVLQAFSRHSLPHPLDYPNWVHTTGFWFLPTAPGWVPSKQLTDFIDHGAPPIYVGFGSMVGKDSHRTGRIVVEAVRLAGVRAVVGVGWGGIQPGEPEENIFYLKDAPHDWLFPRMAAIVHHGGSGTTGAALASGRPQVVCPFLWDQPFNARRMQSCGVAPAPQPQRRLTPDGLAEAISQAVAERSLALRAEELGHRVRTEGGVTSAVEILESYT